MVVELGQLDVLDEKLAEYAFFPLSTVFNESRRLSSRCIELSVQCLQVLVSRGWRQRLQPEMGKQLLILMTLLAGGSPARPRDSASSDELIQSCCECMGTLFHYLGQAQQHIFDETGAKTIVDQTVYFLLETISENPTENVQLSAVHALKTLMSQISNRVLLASLLPRTVSAVTKALTPSTQIRRTYRVLVALLDLLSHVILAVLADEAAIHKTPSQIAESDVATRSLAPPTEDSEPLGDKWLKATASQMKLALANVIKLRNHDKQEVQQSLFDLCLQICEKCSITLADSLQLMVETMAMLANREGHNSAREKQTLKHLVLTNGGFADLLTNSLDAWISTLPRLMQGNDDRPKRQILRQISGAFEILLESGQASDILDNSLASSLVESVSNALDVSGAKQLQGIAEAPSLAQITSFQEDAQTKSFEPVILDHKSQSDSLMELNALISQIKGSVASKPLTRSIMARIAQSLGSQQISALWLSLNLLRDSKKSLSISDLIDIPDEPLDTTPYLISDLYSITLPLLLDSSTISADKDWRITALALESTILEASQLGKSYRPELIDTLYPILSLLGSSEARLQSHAMTALNLLATACEYPNTSTMLVENVDYLINSIALKLNTFDISPQGPQVLLMLLRLCGARLIPYLDDLIGSIFAALDNFHGYPRLVELLFQVLGVVVDEAAKNPTLAITNGMGGPKHRKKAFQPSTLEDILQDIRAFKAHKERREAESLGAQIDDDTPQSAPQRPWTSKLDGPQTTKQISEEEDMDLDDDPENVPTHPQEEKEPSLSKPHILLLSIARSTIPHLSSPSASVRLTLLQLLTRITPILAMHENSFLPLVNDIWPAILPRLFSLETRSTTDTVTNVEEPQDPTYVNIAAADTITAICIGAGDFMGGRIEAIFPRLEKVYRKIWTEIEQDRHRVAQHRGRNRLVDEGSGANLRGAVDLRIVDSSTAGQMDMIQSPSSAFPPPTSSSQTRTSTSAIHNALTRLLTTVLTHVRINDDIGDVILDLLSPIMDEPGREEVRQALEEWNGDAVWVVRERRKQGGDGDGKWKPEPVWGRNGERWEFTDVVF